jgi:hypothetical protein
VTFVPVDVPLLARHRDVPAVRPLGPQVGPPGEQDIGGDLGLVEDPAVAAVVRHSSDRHDHRTDAPPNAGSVTPLGTSGMALAAQVVFVVVSGPPASGKSTLAPALACVQALPLIVKDTIKDVLMSVRPVPDVALPQPRSWSGRSDARCGGGLTDRHSDPEQLAFSPVARSQGPSSPPWPPSSRSSAAPIGRPRGVGTSPGRQSTRWTLSPVAGQFVRSTRTRPSTLPSPWPSSGARWLYRHLTMYGQELTDAGRRVNASHRRQIPLGPGRGPGRPPR